MDLRLTHPTAFPDHWWNRSIDCPRLSWIWTTPTPSWGTFELRSPTIYLPHGWRYPPWFVSSPPYFWPPLLEKVSGKLLIQDHPRIEYGNRLFNRGRASSLLQVSDLSIGIERTDQMLQLTDRVSFDIGEVRFMVDWRVRLREKYIIACDGSVLSLGELCFPALFDSETRIFSAWTKQDSMHCGEIRYR